MRVHEIEVVTWIESLICAQKKMALDRMVEHVRFAFDNTNLAA